jgi:lipoprotein-releasing system permease protein
MNYSKWLIAWRYLKGSGKERSISIMVKICFLGIFIGACSLALVMAIMEGFEQATHEKMQGIHAQLIMKSNGNLLDAHSIEPILKKEFPEIAGYSSQSIGQTIVSAQENNDLANVVMIKAIDPIQETLTSSIASKVIQKTPGQDFTSMIHDNYILIGCQTAATLNLSVGNILELIYVTNQTAHKKSINLEKTDAIVGGIFKTGIEEFDSGLIFCSQELFKHMFNQEAVDQIALKLRPDINEEQTIEKLKSRFKLEVFSWKDLYPALVSALKLEKYVMFIILALITLVASMNMISLLFMHIIQKRGDIAILKTMGMQNGQVSAIFFIMGIIIASIASVCGLAAAWIIGILLQRYPLITLPDAYYVTYIPVHLDIRIFALIFVVIMLMSVVATWLPIRKIKNINIADVLRFEA